MIFKRRKRKKKNSFLNTINVPSGSTQHLLLGNPLQSVSLLGNGNECHGPIRQVWTVRLKYDPTEVHITDYLLQACILKKFSRDSKYNE